MQNQKKLDIDMLLKQEGQQALDKILVWILAGMVVLIPLLIRTAIFDFYSPVINGNILDSGVKTDVFTYHKFIWLIVGTVLLFLVFLYKMLAKGYEIPRSYINIPLLTMIVFVLLSCLFADYKTLALTGQFNRHEGTITYICYLALFFVAANIKYNEKTASYLFYAIVPLLVVNALLGLLHFFGYDVLKSDLFRSLILPSHLSKESLGAGAYISSTINNPNYVSGIAGVLVVLFLTKAILETNMKKQVIDGVLSIIAFSMLLSSLSTSGFVTFILLLPILFVISILSSQRKRAFTIGGSALIIYTIVFAAMNSYNPQVWDESVGFFLGSSKKEMAVERAGEEWEQWRDFAVEHSPLSIDRAEAAKEAETEEFNLPPQQWAAGTGRAYIWSETIKLIKQQPIFGYGLDTLAYFFPQDDPNKNSGINDYRTVVDKPHNTYLGLAFGSGVVVLFAFLILLVRHFFNHLKFFTHRINGQRQVFIISLFTSFLAYLIQALFNDPIIGSGFVFWILFGISVALLREEQTAT